MKHGNLLIIEGSSLSCEGLTSVVGNFWMKPTVSVRRNSFPFFIWT